MHESICTERKFVFGNENVFLDEIKRHYFYLKCICLFIAKVFFSARKLINYHEKCGQKKDRAWAGSPWLFWDYFYLIQKKSSVYNLGKLKNFKT